MTLMNEKEENRKKGFLTTLIGVISTISALTIAFVISMYSDAIELPVKIGLAIIAASIFVVGLFIGMRGERTIGYYKCKHCGETFVPSRANYVFAIQYILARRLKCPQCHKKSFCKKVLTKDDTSDE